MNAEWKKLRAFNGDIRNAFEELICQLANSEAIPGRKQFHRVAAPDAGVEAYCILDNEQVYGWQAKFIDKLGKVQWNQIEASFNTAFIKHPNLVRYYVCTPMDLADPKISGQEWSMDKWKQKVSSWTQFAKRHKRQIEFVYWGNHEIFTRLSKKENQGKMSFWFNTDEFTTDWFNQRLDESISNLAKRYTPELNVSLPIISTFEGLSRGELFKDKCTKAFDSFIKRSDPILKRISGNVPQQARDVKVLCKKIREQYNNLNFQNLSKLDWDLLQSFLEKVTKKTSDYVKHLHELDRKRKGRHKINLNQIQTNRTSIKIFVIGNKFQMLQKIL